MSDDKPAETKLEHALDERAELLDRKDRVLAAFRDAHKAMTERRTTDKGHLPERRAGA